MKDITIAELEQIANKLRIHVVEMTTAASSGHPGGSLSAADFMAVLYFRNLNHDPSDPSWEDRDRFVLSKGHVAPVLYAALAESGYFPVEDLLTLRKMGSKLQGHPVRGKVPGVEMSTGSLGQGLSMACGIAMAGKIDGKSYHTYCLLGDGELQSGQNWEAAMFASQNGLSNLIAVVDRNRLQITGNTEDAVGLEPLPEVEGLRLERDHHQRPQHPPDRGGAGQGRGVPQEAHGHHNEHRQGQGRVVHGEQRRVPRQGLQP